MSRSAGITAPPGFRDSEESALGVGDVIASTYAIKDELARTETGVVFEARDLIFDRAVVMKFAWRDPGTPSLLAEARRCAIVRDPCSVSIYGMGNHNGIEYVVGELVEGTMLADLLLRPIAHDDYLHKLRTLSAAVGRAHECGVAIGDISGSTILVDPTGRMVLGRLSLSQIPAFGPHGQLLAPEILRGDVEAGDPAAAEAIDLYGLGCVAIELACGRAPFSDDGHDLLQGHAYEAPPRISDIRPDLPGELADLVEWLLAKNPAARPSTAQDVLAQLDAVIERLGTKGRTIRVLVVEDDTARARWLWSLVRRAHASVVVEIASEGTDAAHKLNRDRPDLVFIDASMRGVMNALELCMYARGLESEHGSQLVVIGEVAERERAMFDSSIPFIPDSLGLANAVIARVRKLAREAPPRRKPRSTISG